MQNMERTIEIVLDVENGQIYHANDFFAKPEHELIHWRRALEESILLGKPRLVCPYCKQMLKLCGRHDSRGVVSYFSHLYDSDDCEIKTTTELSKEEIEAHKYGQVCESVRHKELKRAIADALSGEKSLEIGISSVETEKKISSQLPYMNWRRPDVQAVYRGKRLVFELQLSTTFLSVVADRDIFYRLNGYYIIWLFNFDNNKEYVNLHNLMCKDIYYANKRNVFIFDNRAQELSIERGELILCCRWLDTNGRFSKEEYLSIEQLSFDEESMKPFYVDADKLYYEVNPHVKRNIEGLERSRMQMLQELMNRQQRELERLQEEYRRIEEIKKHIINTQGIADTYEKDGKFGFIYQDQPLTSPIYSSIEWDQEHQQFRIAKRSRHGLTDRSGNVIIPCICNRIERIEPELYLIDEKKEWRIWGSRSILKKVSTTDQYTFERLTYGFCLLTFEYKERGHWIMSHSHFILFPDLNTIEVDGVDDDKKSILFKGQKYCINPDGNIYRDISDNIKIYLSPAGKVGLSKGQTMPIPAEYDAIDYHSDDCIFVHKGSYHGMLTITNRIIIPTEYHEITSASEDHYLVKNWNGYGLYNKRGTLIIPVNFQNIKIQEKCIICTKSSCSVKYHALYTTDGTEIISIDKMIISIDIREDGFIRIIDQRNKVRLLKPDYTLLLPWDSEVSGIGIFSNGIAECRTDNRYAKIDTEGNISDIVENHPDTIITTCIDERYGLTNCRGQELIPCKYRKLEKLPNGMYIGDDKDLISADARLVRSFFGELSYLNDKLFINKRIQFDYEDNKLELYDVQGNLKSQSHSVILEKNGYLYVESNTKYGRGLDSYLKKFCGLLNLNGNTIENCIYHNITFPYPDIALCEGDGLKKIINLISRRYFFANKIEKLAEIDSETYYILHNYNDITLVNSAFERLGIYLDIAYNSETNIIEVVETDLNTYDALTGDKLSINQTLEIGKTYIGLVTGRKPYGVFVKIVGNHNGMIHSSLLSKRSLSSFEFNIDQRLFVKVINIKEDGKVDLDLATMD